MSPRVLIVDDQRLLADSLYLSLRQEGFRPVVAPEVDPDELLTMVRDDPPALVLLDLDLGGMLGDGASLVAPLVAAGTRVLVLTGTKNPIWVATALEQGALAALDKGIPVEDLLDAVMAAARGRPLVSAGERERVVRDLRAHRVRRNRELAPFESLTPREQQVLRALGDGLTVPRIAEHWVVSEATVRSQVHAVLHKLGVRSQLEAVAAASRVGWLGAPRNHAAGHYTSVG
jgi:DNA-binding NarL/FixJ family response regulator